jgi:UDP-N-acetylmuramyl tripeptide synthase
MKTMTCKQLGGPESCGKEFHAKTFEEMAELSKRHGMEMYKKGDAEHIKVMNKMKEHMNDPGAMKNYMESKKKLFDSLPESQ